MASEQVDAAGPTAVSALEAALLGALGPRERAVLYAQGVLLWHRPRHSALLLFALHGLFWGISKMTLTFRPYFVLASFLLLLISIESWKYRKWLKIPSIFGRRRDDSPSESWTVVHPDLLSVPELCRRLAETWISLLTYLHNILAFKRENRGKFCLIVCICCAVLADVGRRVPGIVVCYLILLAALLWPLASYYGIGHKIRHLFDGLLHMLDYSRQALIAHRSAGGRRDDEKGTLDEDEVETDSEDELAAFYPKLDPATVEEALALSESEPSDDEASYREAVGLGLMRGGTPQLTDGSDDMEHHSQHSDLEDTFARDLAAFPSERGGVGLDSDDDDTLGIPSILETRPSRPRPNSLRQSLPADNEDFYDSDTDAINSEMSMSGLPSPDDFVGDRMPEDVFLPADDGSSMANCEEEQHSSMFMGGNSSGNLANEIVNAAFTAMVRNTLSALTSSDSTSSDSRLATSRNQAAPAGRSRQTAALRAEKGNRRHHTRATGAVAAERVPMTAADAESFYADTDEEAEEINDGFELLDQTELDRSDTDGQHGREGRALGGSAQTRGQSSGFLSKLLRKRH
ncbi:reticulophagy regulator 3-like [Lampetra fluviatilis]